MKRWKERFRKLLFERIVDSVPVRIADGKQRGTAR